MAEQDKLRQFISALRPEFTNVDWTALARKVLVENPQQAWRELPGKLQASRDLLNQYEPGKGIDPRLMDQFMNLTGSFAPMGMTKAVAPVVQSAMPRSSSLLEAAPRESFVPGVEAGKELIVHHNITPEKLARVEKVGGMPVPSLAISNVENPLTGFGEISLIGNKSMAVPSAKNPVFGFDAYTARAPRIDYQIDSKSEKALKNVFSDVVNDVPGGNYRLDRLINEWDGRQYSDLVQAKFLKESGFGLPDRKDFPADWQFSGEINRRVSDLPGQFGDWLAKFEQSLPEQGVNIKERIFRGFTESGNRRYANMTLENLVREMKGGAGSEGINYGVGNLRAVATPKFKKLDDIKASREKIISSNEFGRIKLEISEAYSELTKRISKLEDQGNYAYKPEDVLYDIGQSRNVNIIDRIKVGADDQLKADIGIFIRKLQKLPTEYFEIKPQRGVSVSEFEGAIVPSNAPQKSVDYLRQQGIKDIYYYSTPEERKELFKKFGNQMFSAAPYVGGGLLGAGMYGSEE